MSKQQERASSPSSGPSKRRRNGKSKRALSREAMPRSRWRTALIVGKWAGIGTLAFTALCSVILALMFWHYGSDSSLPRIDKLSDYRPKQVTRIVTADGRVIGEIYEERRTYVPIEEIPPVVVQAFTSAEDADFFEHGGLDYVGMVRAVIVNLRAGKKKQGASTITQQVVKTFLLSPERTFRRKFQEIILARRLEDALTKDEILALYLNQIYFGHGRYGVEEAARYYFGKSIRDVNIGEAAMIAGLPKAPENISPKKPENRERAKDRQQYVLEQMAHHGHITEEEAKYWINRPIEVVADPFPFLNAAPEWVDIARRELVARYGEDELPYLGTTVVVTVDLELQGKARAALRAGLIEVDERQKHGRPLRRLKKDQIELRAAKLARRLPDGGPRVGEVYEAIVLEVHDASGDKPGELVVDLGDWKAGLVLTGARDARFNPDGNKASERFAYGDMVAVTPLGDAAAVKPAHAARAVDFAPGPEGAVVVIDPRTRDVLALVGGYDVEVAGFDRATMAKRQAGSSFKPFVYAVAIDGGEFTAATLVIDAPVVEDDNGDQWRPQNYKKGEYEGRVRLRYALAHSINTVATRVINVVGPAPVAELAHAMGIASELPHTQSLALGAGEVTPIELVNSYASFAAGGVAAPPRIIARVGDEPVPPAEGRQVLRPEVAYIVTDMMRSVVDEGTATKASKLGLPLAGKTGTTNDSRDAWFLGVTPDLVAGVWVGHDDFSPLGKGESGGRAAVPVFMDVMRAASKRTTSRSFPRPPGVVQVRIDKTSGLLAAPGAPDETTYAEVFLDGTAPTEVAPTAGEVSVDDFILDQYGDEPVEAGVTPE